MMARGGQTLRMVSTARLDSRDRHARVRRQVAAWTFSASDDQVQTIAVTARRVKSGPSVLLSSRYVSCAPNISVVLADKIVETFQVGPIFEIGDSFSMTRLVRVWSPFCLS